MSVLIIILQPVPGADDMAALIFSVKVEGASICSIGAGVSRLFIQGRVMGPMSHGAMLPLPEVGRESKVPPNPAQVWLSMGLSPVSQSSPSLEWRASLAK